MTAQVPYRLTPSLRDRIKGALIGLLIGDALGVPYEFHNAEDLPPLDQINFCPPQGFDRTHKNTPPGTWSDDGAQALCLLASLLHSNKLDLSDFSHRLRNWYNLGYMAVDYQVFDVGITTGHAIAKLNRGIPPELAGEDSPASNGNGSLMRVLPLALWHQGSDAQLIEGAHLQSCVTHRHLRSQICCALYCLFARRILQEDKHPWESAVATLKLHYKNHIHAIKELQFYIRPDEEVPPQGSGYVVDSLHAAREALKYDNYQDAVRWAIALGKDTDTTACIVGGIIGLRDGNNKIPIEWQEQLRAKEIYLPLLEQLWALYQ
ncbi:MAG: ADP-ribosylglycohydrolase family protein [Saezia sp.]